MKLLCTFPVILTALLLLLTAPATAEQHRATRLGNPATRFAPPVKTTEELRSRFRDPRLKPDFAAVLEQWGWTGKLEDLFQAAETSEITETAIPVGSTMPFMSSREKGKAICLRNVLWAGAAPAPAYAFNFTSNGQRYRCVTPKACSNFFLEDLGPEPKPALVLKCEVPERVPMGRPVAVCLTVINAGNAIEPLTTLTLAIPPGTTVVSKTDGAAISEDRLTWEIPGLLPNKGKQVCATLNPATPGTMVLASTASGSRATSTQSACATELFGVAAILLETVDLEDPIEVGKEVTYVIKVTNQGSVAGTNIRVVCTLPASQELVSSAGATPASVADRQITMETLPFLEPKAVATWQVIVKALHADDARFKVELRSDQFEEPIREDESTQLY